MSQELMAKEEVAEILQPAFTDHNALVLRLAADTPIVQRGRGRRMMKPILIEEGRIKGKIQQNLAIWKLTDDNTRVRLRGGSAMLKKKKFDTS